MVAMSAYDIEDNMSSVASASRNATPTGEAADSIEIL